MLQVVIFLSIAIGCMALFLALSDVWRYDRTRLRRRLAGEVIAPPMQTKSVELYKGDAEWNADNVTKIDPGTAPSTTTASVKVRILQRHERLRSFLREAGFPMEPRQLLFFNVAGALIAAGVIGLVAGPVAGVMMGLIAVATPWVVLNIRRKIRCERYLKQLVTAFDLMARVLKSGQPVQEAFRAAVAASDEPLATEFGRCQHQIEHGLRPEEAFRELSERGSIVELRIFVIAMTVQRQTGGSLTEVLERLAVIVRTRLKLKQKLRALTAEGRMQSTTLLALPIVTFFIMYFLNRPYAELLLVQWKLLLATGACMGVGVVWIRNIMNFEG